MIDFGPVSPQKISELQERLAALGIREEDIKESFIHGSGKGGQKINKTASAVDLLHEPTQTRVRCQQERLRSLNRFFARRMLADAVEKKLTGKIAAQSLEAEKIRRQKQRRKRRSRSAQPQPPESTAND